MNLQKAFEILDTRYNGIPFEAIEFIYNHPPDDSIIEKVIYNIKNAYNNDIFYYSEEDYYSPAPLWYAIIAEKHHNEELAKHVISLFTTTTDNWDFLNEQGQYLISLLSEKYQNTVPSLVIDNIEKLSQENSQLSYLYLFDALYFADIDKEKERLLKIFKSDFDPWHDAFAHLLVNLRIKEAIPIIQNKVEVLKNIKTLNQSEKFNLIELEDALEHNSELLLYHEINYSGCYYKKRGHWKKHYNRLSNYFVEESETKDIKNFTNKKVGRNDKCPCGSGLKFKKCCIGKGIFD